MTKSKLPYCQAQTRSQSFGSSYASTSWGCQRKARWTVDGTPMCTQHKDMVQRDRPSREFVIEPLS